MARAEEEKDRRRRRMERGRMEEGVRESRRERARARVEQWAPRDDAVRRSVKTIAGGYKEGVQLVLVAGECAHLSSSPSLLPLHT